MNGTEFEYYDLASKIIIGLVTGIAAAFLTAKFALNRFYKEKWWEKRLASFTDVIDKAYRVKMTDCYFLNLELSLMQEQDDTFNRHPPEQEKLLKDLYWEDIQELERIAQLSDFTLTPKASKLSNDFVKKRAVTRSDFRDDAINSLDGAEKDLEASEKLLDGLVQEAKRALKIK